MSIALPVTPSRVIENYSDLVAQIADWTDDFDEGALGDSLTINRFIGFAEAYFNRKLRTEDMLVEGNLEITEEITTLPTDFLSMGRASAVVDSDNRPLKNMSPVGILEQFGGRAGRPVAYSIEGKRIRIARVGDTTISFQYYARIAGLSSDNASNWLLERHPDIYLAGAMVYAEKYIDDPRLVQEWKFALDEGIDDIIKDTARNRWGVGPIAPHGVPQVPGARC